MPDIVISNVPAATVAEIDRRAGELGMSRSDFLRRWLDQNLWTVQHVSADDLRRFRRLNSDGTNGEATRQAGS